MSLNTLSTGAALWRAQLPGLHLWLKLFVLGGLLGALCDQIHVQGQVLSYAEPLFAGQAWWVAPNFGLATCVMYLTTSLWVRWSERLAPAPVTRGELARHALWFLAAYGLSAGMQLKPLWLTMLYAILFVRRLLRRNDVGPQLANALCLAAGGTLAESALASTGAFAYRAPDLGYVPMWLPGIYLHGSLLAMAVVRALRQRGRLG